MPSYMLEMSPCNILIFALIPLHRSVLKIESEVIQNYFEDFGGCPKI